MSKNKDKKCLETIWGKIATSKVECFPQQHSLNSRGILSCNTNFYAKVYIQSYQSQWIWTIKLRFIIILIISGSIYSKVSILLSLDYWLAPNLTTINKCNDPIYKKILAANIRIFPLFCLILIAILGECKLAQERPILL